VDTSHGTDLLPARPAHSFVAALTGSTTPLIMEVKRRDARGNDLFRGRSISTIVEQYREAGAPCLSVVTGEWFGGTAGMLDEVARHTTLPILLKDFVTRRSQLASARDRGATAVLLTATLLAPSVVRGLVDRCLELGLTPFFETSNGEEIRTLGRIESCVVAVNNKEIRQRERDRGEVERSLRLLPLIRERGCHCPVSASAIERPEVAAQLLDRGFSGLLVGTALLRASSPSAFVDGVAACRANGSRLNAANVRRVA
jgi:indole-3-glycerol phosphate synthase